MSDTLTIITNNVPRDLIDGWELSPDERAHFDYIDWDAIEEGTDSATFFRYKGELYDLGDVPAVESYLPEGHPFHAWHGYLSDSFFSGILVRYDHDDSDRIIVGRYYS